MDYISIDYFELTLKRETWERKKMHLLLATLSATAHPAHGNRRGCIRDKALNAVIKIRYQYSTPHPFRYNARRNVCSICTGHVNSTVSVIMFVESHKYVVPL